mgnify:CR=1 FL=1
MSFLLYYVHRAEEADVIVVLIDPLNRGFLSENSKYIDPKKTIVAYSKSDLLHKREIEEISNEEILFVSSLSGEGIDNLKSKIVEIALKRFY